MWWNCDCKLYKQLYKSKESSRQGALRAKNRTPETCCVLWYRNYNYSSSNWSLETPSKPYISTRKAQALPQGTSSMVF